MNTKFGRLRRVFPAFAACLAFALAGCNHVGKTTPPRFRSSSPTTGTIETKGDAAEPAKVETAKTETEIPIPAASRVTLIPATLQEPAKTVIEPAAPTVARTVVHQETVTAPKAFTPPAPPAPPTPAEVAHGTAVRWFYLAALVSFALAGLAAWGQHYLAAVKFGLAGVAFPLLARFFNSTAAMVTGGILLAAGAAFFVAWYVMKGRPSPFAAPLEAKAPATDAGNGDAGSAR